MAVLAEVMDEPWRGEAVDRAIYPNDVQVKLE
jgi:hypothetical protein